MTNSSNAAPRITSDALGIVLPVATNVSQLPQPAGKATLAWQNWQSHLATHTPKQLELTHSALRQAQTLNLYIANMLFVPSQQAPQRFSATLPNLRRYDAA